MITKFNIFENARQRKLKRRKSIRNYKKWKEDIKKYQGKFTLNSFLNQAQYIYQIGLEDSEEYKIIFDGIKGWGNNIRFGKWYTINHKEIVSAEEFYDKSPTLCKNFYIILKDTPTQNVSEEVIKREALKKLKNIDIEMKIDTDIYIYNL